MVPWGAKMTRKSITNQYKGRPGAFWGAFWKPLSRQVDPKRLQNARWVTEKLILGQGWMLRGSIVDAERPPTPWEFGV